MLALCSTPVALENQGFSVRVVSLSWSVPNIALGTRVSALHDLAVGWTFPGGHDLDMHAQDLAGMSGISQLLDGAYIPAICASLGPLTAPLAPCVMDVRIFIY